MKIAAEKASVVLITCLKSVIWKVFSPLVEGFLYSPEALLEVGGGRGSLPALIGCVDQNTLAAGPDRLRVLAHDDSVDFRRKRNSEGKPAIAVFPQHRLRHFDFHRAPGARDSHAV